MTKLGTFRATRASAVAPRRWPRLAAPLIAILLGRVAGLPAQGPGAIGPALIRDTTLENGLQVIALRNPTAPFAYAMLAFRAGAFTQATEAEAGVPHLIEHMMFQSWGGGRSEVGSLEGGYNGSTGDEMVNYYVVLPGKNAAKVIKPLSDLARNARFNARDLLNEARVVRNEIERHVAEPAYLLEFSVNLHLWGDDWTRKNPGGNVLSVQGATPAMLEALHKKYYTPNNAALIVTGDIDVAEIFAAARQAFKDWKKGPAVSALDFRMKPLAVSKAITVDASVPDVTIRAAWHGPSAQGDATGAMAADLLAAMVNSPSSSFQRNLVDEGLFQSVRMEYDLANYVGPIVITAKTTPGQLVAATAALQKEIAALSDPQTFTDRALALARKAWQVESAIEWERGTSLVFPIARHWSVAGLDSYRKYGDQIMARTADDVRQLVARYITGKPKAVGVMIAPVDRATMGANYQRAIANLEAR